jgi:hypothetical protein
MARALIVGCGCRGRSLGAGLVAQGWLVRGTTRDADGLAAIEAAGFEGAVADPDRLATVLDQIEGVALIFWLLGSARGDPEPLVALHGSRLERLLEEIVDTHVRGLVYEGAGSVDAAALARGAGLVREAGERWRIPVTVTSSDPQRHDAWREEMLAAARRLIG